MKRNIIINDKATVEAIGTLTGGHCKPVVCITDIKYFTSVSDAAEYYGVHPVCISQVCNGKLKTAGKKEFCFLKDLPMHLDKIARQHKLMMEKQQKLEADAAVGRAIREAEEKRLEEERKAEEERLNAIAKAEEEKQKAIEKAERECSKANKECERRQRMVDRAKAEYIRLIKLCEEAEQHSNEANARLMGLKGE